MPKGMVEAAAPETGLTALRDDIRELEITAANLRGRGAGVLDVFRLRDSVQEHIEALAERGLDLRAEKTRLETVDNMIRRQGGLLSREMAETGGMEAARVERRPPERFWWWFADIVHAQQMRKLAIRYGAIFVGLLALLLIVNAVLTSRFGLSPTEQQAYDHTAVAERLVSQEDWAGAIAEYEAANVIAPSADQYAWLVVLYTMQGDTAKTEETATTLETFDADRRAVYNQVAQDFSMVGEADASETWALKALALDENYAQTWLSLGTAAETRGDSEAAIKLYEEAARLASEQDNDALYVLARMRMGMLMGGGSSGPSGAGF